MATTSELPEHLVRLNTLLNVAAVHPRALKRPLDPESDWHAIAKRFKKSQKPVERIVPLDPAPVDDKDEADAADDSMDSYKHHFGVETTLLSPVALATLESQQWIVEKTSFGSLGPAKQYALNGVADDTKLDAKINPRLKQKLSTWSERHTAQAALPAELLAILSTYKDVFVSSVQTEAHETYRAATALHAMSHVLKTRNRVLRNNETLAQANGAPADDAEVRDQGFTRPKVLILLPFRNSAAAWLELLTTLSLASSVENKSRFDAEFTLPAGTTDKLAGPDAGLKYPADHIATFKGNIDDSFRVGLKVTRKSIKCFSEFYQSDIILASPLGLRMSIEKERNSDFLSSLEVVVVDQADVLTMQNWEHVQFVMDRINKIPADAHGADFSRIKPWYLDGKSANLRHTIMFSSYESPEMRALFRSCVNVAGKLHFNRDKKPAIKAVRRGVQQIFVRLEVANPAEEDDARFEHFKAKTMPALLKSAVASSGHTMIFVPSYFDFLRVEAHLKTIEDLEFACISEYSSNSDIARARNAFLAGKLPFLVLTERFHFFKRYRIRGARTLVFYALPDHADFYKEVMTLPFEQVAGNKYDLPDESEVSCQILFSPFDILKLERIVGSQNARKLLKDDDSSYTFA